MAIRIDLVRPDDLLNLSIEGLNLRLDSNDPEAPALVVEDSTLPAYLRVTFPPQTIAEPAYFEASGVVLEPLDPPGQPLPPRRTAAQLGHPSRLVFAVPPAVRIPFSVAGLLDWSGLQLHVNPIAAIGPSPTPSQIAAAPAIRAPSADETSIELPYRLVISPTAEVTWKNRIQPFTVRGRTELWHTRLMLTTATGVVEPSRAQPAPLRAIWSPDYNPKRVPAAGDPDPDLARTAMSANDRHQIVILTSAFHGYEVDEDADQLAQPLTSFLRERDLTARLRFRLTTPYVPQPFEAEQLLLSPLGGWLRSRGHWTPPHTATPMKRRVDVHEVLRPLALPQLGPHVTPAAHIIPTAPTYQLDLSEWVHVATLGRDHYVRIVYEGELWPFRHRAALIKVTERKFKEAHGIIGAYLMQRMFIVVRQPEKRFADDDRANPLKRVRLTTLVTPDIADPQLIAGTNRSFWVEVMTSASARDRFRFHVVGTDIAGDTIDFTMPLLFVSISDVQAALDKVAAEYNAKSNIAIRGAHVPGQKVTFAPADPSAPNHNTQLVTQTLNYVVDKAGNPPRLLKADVTVPQVQALLGTDAPTTIRFFADYVASGFDAASGVFAEIVKEDLSKYTADDPFAGMVANTLGVDFSADKAGGFATPNLGVSTLTRALGPLAGKVTDAVSGAFDPATFFQKGMATLFGCFDLVDLLPAATLDKNAPKLRTQSIDIPGGKRLTVTLDWEPTISSHDFGVAAFTKDHNGTSTLQIHGIIEKPVTLGAPSSAGTAEFTGRLNAFQVSVLKSVFLNFTEFRFSARTGQKTDVSVTLDRNDPVEFDGDLKFVKQIRDAIPPNLFGDGPSLDISPTGVRAGFALALPPLAVGVFALKDVSLGAALTLPFLDGKPVFDFNVSERPHPFLLSVSLFGGGGFFHLQLDTAGMKALEVALEFGATAAIDIGVASGEVHIMAGIYFSLQRKENSTDLAAVLTGYLRMGGSLSVLCLVKVSVEFNLSFTYDSGRDKAYGRATLTVEVEVAFFSKSVELTVERAFGGSGDPTFRDLFTSAAMWNEYALAFAA